MATKTPRRPARRLAPAEQRLVESLGLYFERSGAPRISGRMLALLMLTDGPVALEDIAATLQISRASASTNARLLAAGGLAEHTAEPGDRRHLYAYVPGVWAQRLADSFGMVTALQKIARDGLEGLGRDDRTGRARLRELDEFCEFFAGEFDGLVARWRAREAAKKKGARR